jgi:hypothetical protein
MNPRAIVISRLLELVTCDKIVLQDLDITMATDFAEAFLFECGKAGVPVDHIDLDDASRVFEVRDTQAGMRFAFAIDDHLPTGAMVMRMLNPYPYQ